MTNVAEVVSSEDLAIVTSFRLKAAEALALAKAAVADSRAAEAEYNNQVLRVFIKYKLNFNDSFDQDKGTIIRQPVAVPDPLGVQAEPTTPVEEPKAQ
jgi:hypothetical protein